MRIIAGVARRIELEVAEGSTTRPFLEMARGALFNSLGDFVVDARLLDLYAGSGALGLEALSRGGGSCVFVEQDNAACRALAKNIGKCGMASRSRVVRGGVETVLSGLDGNFDLIFCDPPFPDLPEWRTGGRAEGVMRHVARLLAPGGLVIFRIEDRRATAPDWPGLALAADKKYGRSRVCRYGKEEESPCPPSA